MRTPADAASGQRLEGWKAIARYLGKDPRTALRWVELGLPVRRVNGRNSSVYAYAEELEEWLRRGAPDAAPTAPGGIRRPSEAELLSLLVRAEPAVLKRILRFLAGLSRRGGRARAAV